MKTLSGDGAQPAEFPVTGSFTQLGGDGYRGELNCFAVDSGDANQIAWNHLHGTATVFNLDNTAAGQPKQALKYNAWAFTARGPGGASATNGSIMGTPGDLVLDGGNSGTTYDACPLYNISTFSPNRASLGNVTTLDNTLSVVSCNQDLRQDFVINLTKLQYTVWNANENSFEGSWQCADSVQTVGLDDLNARLTAPTNFDFSVLQTADARFEVQGVASTQCKGSAAAALLGIVNESIALGSDTKADGIVANNTSGAGALSGFVLWDPAQSTVPQIRR